MKSNCQKLCASREGLGLVLMAVLAGCAGTPRQSDEAAGADSLLVDAAKVAAAPVQAPGNGEGKYKFYPGSGIMAKASAAPPFEQRGGELTLSFEGADLREVVKTILSDILKESYIMDPRVGGTITLHTKRPIPRVAVLPTLETVLRMNGAVLLRQEDGVYQIIPANLAGKGNLTPSLAEPGKPLANGYGIQVVPLKYIGAAEMVKLLEPLGVEPGAVRQDSQRNLLILSGTEPELRHMLATVDMFDVDWISGMSVGVYTLQNAEAKAVLGELEQMFGDKGMGPFGGAVRLVPLDRLNALLAVTPQASYLDQVGQWIERLDRSGVGDGGEQLFVYQVQNGKAESLAGLLNDVFGKKSSQGAVRPPELAPGATPVEVSSKDAGAKTPAPAPARAADNGLTVPRDVRVIADKDNNALLILASAADYGKIESALRKLDVVPRQVLIEVTIAEVTLTDELSFGLEWLFKSGTRTRGHLATGDSTPGLNIPGIAYSWLSRSGEIQAFLNILATDSKLKIISSPHITVADNQKASIQVGDRVPTITQTQATTTTDTVISSVQYLDTGVLLSVTPRVNASGLVNMEISQEISSATETLTSTIDSPTIQKRTAQSTVTVQSEETLVMAGLIREENNRGSSGVPLLSEIPIMGGLFGTNSRKETRTELIVLITPRVLHTVQQAVEVTEAYRARLSGLEQKLKRFNIGQPELDAAAERFGQPALPKTGPVPFKPRSAAPGEGR